MLKIELFSFFFPQYVCVTSCCQSVLPIVGSLSVYLPESFQPRFAVAQENSDQHVQVQDDTIHQSWVLWQNLRLLVSFQSRHPKWSTIPTGCALIWVWYSYRSQSDRTGCDSSMMETVNWPSRCVRAVIDSAEKELKGRRFYKCVAPALLIHIGTTQQTETESKG